MLLQGGLSQLFLFALGKTLKQVGIGQNSVPVSSEWGSASPTITVRGNKSGEAWAGLRLHLPGEGI